MQIFVGRTRDERFSRYFVAWSTLLSGFRYMGHAEDRLGEWSGSIQKT